MDALFEFRQAPTLIGVCGLLPALLMILLTPAPVHAAPAGPTAARVDSEAQAVRDTERLRILEAELASEQQQVVQASQRRAERLALHDAQAALEVEQAQARAVANVDALRREIASVKANAGTPSGSDSSLVKPTPRRASVSWWDVYAKAPSPRGSSGPPTGLYHALAAD